MERVSKKEIIERAPEDLLEVLKEFQDSSSITIDGVILWEQDVYWMKRDR